MNDQHYRRLQYLRYADDFTLSYIGPKAEAEATQETISAFLKDRLNLEMSASKTLITHARTKYARFLGYAINVYQSDDKLFPRQGTQLKLRIVSGSVRLGIPYGKVDELVARYRRKRIAVYEGGLLRYSDATSVKIYQQRFRSNIEFYKYAADRRRLQSSSTTWRSP